MNSEEMKVPSVNKTALDHVLVLIKAGLASAPFTGGGAVLIDEYIGNSTRKSIELANQYFLGRIKELENRIDLERVDEDAISDAVKQYFRIVLNNSSHDKLKAAAYLLANAMLARGDSAKLPMQDLDYFSRCIDDLSTGAISLLGVAFDIVQSRGSPDPTHDQRSIRPPVLQERVPDLDMDLAAGLITELDARALVTLPRGPAYNRGELEGGALSFWISSLGIRFAKHLLDTDHNLDG